MKLKLTNGQIQVAGDQWLGFEGPVLGLQKDQGLDWTGLI